MPFFLRLQLQNFHPADHWGKLPYVLFALVCFQSLLGMWMVTMKLYPPTVAAHLFGGFFTFTLLSLFVLRVMKWEQLSVLARRFSLL